MNKIEFAIRKYAVAHYGDLVIPNTPIFDDKAKVWTSQLRSTYPRIIADDASDERLVGFLDLTDLGSIQLDDNLQIVNATSSEKCDEQLSARLDLWKQQTERIVIRTSSDVFAKIEEGIHVLNPLELIFDQLIKTAKDSEIKISDSSIHEQNNPDRIAQYLELLLELDVVRRIQGGYVRGNVCVGLLEKSKNTKSLKTSLLSYVIEQKYTILRQVFGITQLEPYVHLANAYYSASLETEKLIHIRKSNLYHRYQNYYSRISEWAFDSKVNELVDKGAFEYDGDYLVGQREYFDNMLKLKEKIQLNPITS